MKAVIPCAMKKENMFPFSESKPTGLMPVMDRSLVEHLVHDLLDIGVEEVYLVTNHLEEQFEERFDEVENVEVVHQEELDGTAGAVETCDFIEEDFFVVNGDVIVSRDDLEALNQKHDGNSVTMLATGQDRPEKFGVLSITNDRVEAIVEKPEEPDNALVNTGIYVFSPEIFDIIEDLDGEKSLTDAVTRMVDRNGARFELIEDYWMDIDSPRTLWKADRVKREYMETRMDGEIAESAVVNGTAVIEEGAQVKPGTVLEGEVYIGRGAVVGPNTTVKDSTVSRGCEVRSCSIEDSLLFEDGIVDPFTAVERSVLGEEIDFKSCSAIRESFIGARSFVATNNSIRGVKFVPDARTDLGEISK